MENKEKSKSKVKSVFNILLDIFLVLLIILAGFFAYFKICYDEAYVIGPSMYPTLNANENKQDIVAINTKADFTYGDIVTATTEKKDSKGNAIVIIKRVIALEGDYIDLQYNENDELIVLLNGEELDEPYIIEKARKEDSPVCYQNWQEYKASASDRINAEKGLLLGKNEVFLMGDNRQVSNDSTIMGPFKKSAIQGKVDFVFHKGENDFFMFMKKVIFKAE